MSAGLEAQPNSKKGSKTMTKTLTGQELYEVAEDLGVLEILPEGYHIDIYWDGEDYVYSDILDANWWSESDNEYVGEVYAASRVDLNSLAMVGDDGLHIRPRWMYSVNAAGWPDHDFDNSAHDVALWGADDPETGAPLPESHPDYFETIVVNGEW